MRKEIIKGLFNPLDRFCAKGCAVKAKSLESYIDGVRMTGICEFHPSGKQNNSLLENSLVGK